MLNYLIAELLYHTLALSEHSTYIFSVIFGCWGEDAVAKIKSV